MRSRSPRSDSVRTWTLEKTTSLKTGNVHTIIWNMDSNGRVSESLLGNPDEDNTAHFFGLSKAELGMPVRTLQRPSAPLPNSIRRIRRIQTCGDEADTMGRSISGGHYKRPHTSGRRQLQRAEELCTRHVEFVELRILFIKWDTCKAHKSKDETFSGGYYR